MIAAHQASNLPAQFFVATSSHKNGTIRHPALDKSAAKNIKAWCQDLRVPLASTVGLYVTYGTEHSYTDIVRVDAPLDAAEASIPEGWLHADALVTDVPGLALLLPVADCNAVVYADPVKGVIVLAHLGWHATIRDLAAKVVRYLAEEYGSRPEDISVYNSPSIRADSYRFTHLENTDQTLWHNEPYAVRQPDATRAIDLVKYNYDQWTQAGILPEHIEIVGIDTAKSKDYPSHFAGETGRFAVLAMLKP